MLKNYATGVPRKAGWKPAAIYAGRMPALIY
jgi:hypothetical protein